jgi:acyl dehydratase
MTIVEGEHAATAREVAAFNLAAASENKIHDDAVARRLGFAGGLVPGVAVYAYMAHMPVARWGRAWLDNGIAECRFRKPVYDGALVRITATADGDRLALDVESGGLVCASGEARMAGDGGPAPLLGAMPQPPPAAERPPASEASLAVGRALGIAPVVVDRAALAAYLDAVRETDPLYRAEGLVHPGQILQLANRALLENVVLGPWIHQRSRVRHHAAACVGEELTLRGRIAANAEVKGHATVELDAVVTADEKKIVAEITHVAIWRPRQLAQDGAAT